MVFTSFYPSQGVNVGSIPTAGTMQRKALQQRKNEDGNEHDCRKTRIIQYAEASQR